MSTIKTMELIDDIRNDALILMKNDSNLSYLEAFEQARKNLIGDEQILRFEFKPFEVKIDDSLLSNNVEENLDENDYYSNIKKELKKFIDIKEYTDEQLEQYYIGIQMNVDIVKFANKNFSPKQIKFLCVMLASGKNVDRYLNDYGFDPNNAISEIISREMAN